MGCAPKEGIKHMVSRTRTLPHDEVNECLLDFRSLGDSPHSPTSHSQNPDLQVPYICYAGISDLIHDVLTASAGLRMYLHVEQSVHKCAQLHHSTPTWR